MPREVDRGGVGCRVSGQGVWHHRLQEDGCSAESMSAKLSVSCRLRLILMSGTAGQACYIFINIECSALIS